MGIAVGIMLLFGLASVATAALSTIMGRGLIRALAKLPPGLRSNSLLVWSGAPLMAGMASVAMVLGPKFVALAWLGADHCLEHTHHAHLCPVHSAWLTGGILETVALAALALAVLWWLMPIGRQLLRSHRALRTLQVLASKSNEVPGAWVVDSKQPIAVTAGLFARRVMLSRWLVDNLSPEELAIVFEHEQAHRRRFDGVRLLLARIMAGLHLPATRALILDQLSLSIEQACDQSAAKATGDCLRVAETILKLTRVTGWERPGGNSLALSFIAEHPVRRIEHLLDPLAHPPQVFTMARLPGAAILMACGILASDWWHHAAESLLALPFN